MEQLKPSNFTILQQCAELLDLCAGTEERRAEIARKMEAISLHMDRLRSAVASLPGIAISQLDQKKVLAECQQDLEESLTELAEYGQDYAEYEATYQRQHTTNVTLTNAAASATTSAQDGMNAIASEMDGYITTTLDVEDAPIFSLDTVQFQVPNKIISLAVSNDVLVLVIEGAKILRIKLQEAHNIIEADVPVAPTTLRACNVFLDPTGRHLLLSTPQGENFYYYEGWDHAKPLSKFKNMEITAVAWNGFVVENAALLPYPTLSTSATADVAVAEQPGALALTEFHILLQYSDRVCALNMLNSKLVYEHEVAPGSPDELLMGLTVDETKRTFWLHSPANIFELVVTDEDRDIWNIYLSRRKFEAALQHCYNDAQRDTVLRAQAELLFAEGDYVGSAECFARTTVSFEEAVLRFMEIKDNKVMRSYLLSKLATLKKQDRTQITLLVMWLIEIYLSSIGSIDAKIASTGAAAASTSATQINAISKTESSDGSVPGDVPLSTVTALEKEKSEVQSELYSLVEEYKSSVDSSTTYQLAESHGRRDFWLYYASLCGDYERIVDYWMEKEEYIRAIEVLGHHGSPEMFYRYAPALMSTEPVALVEVLMRQPNLTPNKLIPALMRYEHNDVSGADNQSIRYLRFCIQKQMCRDPIVYNYYLTLLAKDSTSADESELMTFLTTYGKGMLYDPDYALRMCKRYGRIQSCVHLYSLLKLHEDAVDLALKQGDIELAQIHAERPEDDKLCKRLWLKIARHAIQAKEPASEVMELVRRSNRLGVEDILPFFPDFTRVDDFKDDICVALEDYESQIQDLRGEMDEATRTAEAMQRDMTGLKSRFAILSTEESCQVCGKPLWLRQFYVFPCQHSFHGDCLTRRVVGCCNRVQRRRIQELQTQMVDITKQRRQLKLTPLVRSRTSDKASAENDEQLEQQLRRARQQLNSLVAGECVLCGESMIKSIAEPLVNMDDLGTPASVADDSWSI
ncbi:tethering complex subunit [Coemansia sp. RSA 1365]|nr:tethering complex subunit [Coemansia sp. RSA 1365]